MALAGAAAGIGNAFSPSITSVVRNPSLAKLAINVGLLVSCVGAAKGVIYSFVMDTYVLKKLI